MAASYLVRGLFDVHVGRLRLAGVDDVDVVVLLHLALAALDLPGVEHQYQHAAAVAGEIAQAVHQPGARGVQVFGGQLLEPLPGEDDVVAVHQQVLGARVLGPGGRAARLAAGGRRALYRAHGLHAVAADGAVGALEDGHQLLVRGQGGAVGVGPLGAGYGGLLGGGAQALAALEDAWQVHVGGRFVPAHEHARAVAAKDGVRGVFRVGVRVVAGGGDDLLRVVALGVASRQAGELPAPAGVGRHLPRVAHQLRDGRAARDDGLAALGDGRVELREEPRHVGQGAAHGLLRQAERERIPGLQQHAVPARGGSAQAMADGTVGGLAEVAALRVLGVRAAGGERELHVCQRRAGEGADVRLFGQVREDEPLPVERKLVRGAVAGQLYAAAALAGGEQQMHFRIVAQRLIVPHALRLRADGLLVQDAALVKGHFEAEAALQQALQYLQLHLAHQLQVGRAGALVPDNVQQRVLLLQLAQLAQGGVYVAAVGQQHAVAQHRLQRGRGGVRLKAQALAGVAVRKAGDGADRARRRGVEKAVFGPGIEPQLVGLGAPGARGVRP